LGALGPNIKHQQKPQKSTNPRIDTFTDEYVSSFFSTSHIFVPGTVAWNERGLKGGEVLQESMTKKTLH
jgi:hypothetical protein